MTIVELRCKPFVADYLKKKYGERIKVTARGIEMAQLKALMITGCFSQFHYDFINKYPSKIEIEFPNLFIWKSGKVGIPYTAVMDFNSFVRDIIVDGLNAWMDAVSYTIKSNEPDLIINYLIQVAGIDEENINLDTWKKIRQRYKVGLNKGPLRKNQPVQFVPNNFKVSLTDVKA